MEQQVPPLTIDAEGQHPPYASSTPSCRGRAGIRTWAAKALNHGHGYSSFGVPRDALQDWKWSSALHRAETTVIRRHRFYNIGAFLCKFLRTKARVRTQKLWWLQRQEGWAVWAASCGHERSVCRVPMGGFQTLRPRSRSVPTCAHRSVQSRTLKDISPQSP